MMFGGNDSRDEAIQPLENDQLLPLILEYLPKKFNMDFVEWANVDYCQLCKKGFSKLKMKGRHHCRRCGRAVCDQCSKDNNLQLS